MTVGTDISEFNAHEWANFGGEFLKPGQYVQKIWSQARTLDSILNEAQSPTIIDLISIDTEGAEYEILKDFNFSKFKFRYILIESKINSLVCRLLIANKYELLEEIGSNLFFRIVE